MLKEKTNGGSDMKKAVVVGCGRLGKTIAEALAGGAVNGVELAGVYNRTFEKTKQVAEELSVHAVETFEELLNMKPDYVVEAASPLTVKEIAVPVLKAGADLLVLSTGAFSDSEFYENVQCAAEENDGHVYLVPGAVGGFDILQAATMSGEAETTFNLQKFSSTSGRTDGITTDIMDFFDGTVEELYRRAPSHLNVSVSTALASNGMQNTKAKVKTGDGMNFTIECEGEFGKALIRTEMAKGSKLIAYSAVSVLKKLNQRITF